MCSQIVFPRSPRSRQTPVSTLGASPVWGPDGRRFKSCLPDRRAIDVRSVPRLQPWDQKLDLCRHLLAVWARDRSDLRISCGKRTAHDSAHERPRGRSPIPEARLMLTRRRRAGQTAGGLRNRRSGVRISPGASGKSLLRRALSLLKYNFRSHIWLSRPSAESR